MLTRNDFRRLAIERLHQRIDAAIKEFETAVLEHYRKDPAQKVVVKALSKKGKTEIESVEEITAILPPEAPAKRRRGKRSSVLEHITGPSRPVGWADDAELEESAPIAKGPIKLLLAIADAGDAGATREMLTVATSYTRSTRDKYLTVLEREGLALELRGRWVITQVGKGELPREVAPLPKGAALRKHYIETLKPEGLSLIAQVLFSAFPQDVERTAIDVATGFTRSTRDKYLSKLIGRLIAVETRRGFVSASPHLFIHGSGYSIGVERKH